MTYKFQFIVFAQHTRQFETKTYTFYTKNDVRERFREICKEKVRKYLGERELYFVKKTKRGSHHLRLLDPRPEYPSVNVSVHLEEYDSIEILEAMKDLIIKQPATNEEIHEYRRKQYYLKKKSQHDETKEPKAEQ